MEFEIRPPKSYPVPGHEGLESTYGWHPGMPKNIILRISKSSFGGNGFCQQQYFIKWGLGVKEPPNDAMTRGSNVHDATEDFYRDLNIENASSMRSYGYDKLLQHFRGFIPHANPKRGLFKLDEEVHLDKLLTAEAKRFMVSEPQHFLPIANEIPLDAVVEIDGQLVHLTGIIDRMFMDGEGNIHIHELKTGVWKDKPKKWESMRKEMAFYVYLLNKCDHPKLGGQNAAYWGWDHTAGLLDTYDDRVFRHIENIKPGILSAMKKDISFLIRQHNGWDGGIHGPSFPLKDIRAVRWICEPWCRVKGYCPRYERVAMPYEEEE